MSNKEPIWKEPLLIAIGVGAVARWLGADQRFSILAGIAVFIYAVYLGSIYSESGKQAAVEKLKEGIVVGWVTILTFVGTFAVMGWLNIDSAWAIIPIWIALIVVFSLLFHLCAFFFRKK